MTRLTDEWLAITVTADWIRTRIEQLTPEVTQ